VPLYAAIILKDKLSIFSWIGIGSMLAGLYFLTMTNGYHFYKGDFLILMCAMFFALHGVFTSKFLKGQSGRQSYHLKKTLTG